MMCTSFDIFQNHFKIILPEFFFVCAILIILIYGTLYNASAYYKYPILTYIIGWLSIQTLLKEYMLGYLKSILSNDAVLKIVSSK